MQKLKTLFVWVIILVGLLLGNSTKIIAQSRSYVYQHLDREDGLASSIVLAILQDREGYMWFGTDNGLQRYDGRKFIHYRHQLNNPNSLGSDIVEALLQDTKGNIWMVSPSNITRFSPSQNTFTRIPVLASFKTTGLPRQWQLHECNGNLVLASHDRSVSTIFVSSKQAFLPITSTKVQSLVCDTSPINNAISLPGNEHYNLYKDKQGNTWAGADQFFVQYAGTSQFQPVPQSNTARYNLVYNHIYSIFQNQGGTIWLGTDKGIYYFNPGKQRFFTVNPITISGNNFSESDAVSGFLETSAGEIWVSSLNKGLRVYDQQFRLLRNFQPTPLGPIQQASCVIEDHLHQIWAGGNGMLFQFKNANSPVKILRPTLLKNQIIVKAALDKTGTIWWGTNTGLLIRHNPETGQMIPLDLKSQISFSNIGPIKRILFGLDGTLWVATSLAGVLQINTRNGTILAHYTTATRPKGLLSNETGEMIWLNDSTLAISTNQGLHFLNLKNNKITYLTTANGLPANTILNVIKASDKYLFLTTQFSLSRWNTQTKNFTNYGVRDGIVNESYAFNTGYQLRDGRILLGTLQGFYYFHPDSLRQSPPPNVRITGFRIFDQNIPVKDSTLPKEGIYLDYNQNFFTIEFASLNYYDDNKINYEYKLEGVDPNWRKAGQNRFASYTNLDGGTYQFKVRARLQDGTTSRKITTFPLVIAQPFWEAWWFLALIILLVVLLIFSIYKLRIHRILALQQVRTRIARDLHDDMGSTLSTITIFSDLAKQQALTNPTVTQNYLNKISDYSHQMMTTMDDIVWSINPNNDSLQNLTARMREVATELLEAKNITFSIQTDPILNTTRLPLELRYDCFMIFKEALNNIAKYAQCTQVWINLSLAGNNFFLEIKDNGQGFNVQTANSGNGLLNMQKRAQNRQGYFQIKSVIGQGTTIVLSVPLPKITFNPIRV